MPAGKMNNSKHQPRQLMKILVLDNYDSFTYNLVYILRQLGHFSQLDVYRNDKISIEAVADYDKILLSPGPGVPADAGIMPHLIQRYSAEKSILGICLGHQGIGEAFGAELINLSTVKHGLEDVATISEPENYLFNGLPSSFKIGLYHSWAVKPESVPEVLKVTALDKDGNIMGIRHKDYDVQGLQFHPESIMTENGVRLMKNWLGEEGS